MFSSPFQEDVVLYEEFYFVEVHNVGTKAKRWSNFVFCSEKVILRNTKLLVEQKSILPMYVLQYRELVLLLTQLLLILFIIQINISVWTHDNVCWCTYIYTLWRTFSSTDKISIFILNFIYKFFLYLKSWSRVQYLF